MTQQLPFNIDDYNNKIYVTWFNYFNDTFIKDMQRNAAQCVIKVPEYGPDVYYTENDKFMIDNALKNFYYILSSKGYSYTESNNEIEFNDDREGKCIMRDKIIKVNLI